MYDFVVDGLGKNVIVEENEGELEMKKYELSAFVNFDNCFESQFPVGGEVGALNRVYGHLKGMCASGDDVLLGISLVEGGHRRSMGAICFKWGCGDCFDLSRGISRCGVLVEDMSFCFLTYVANGTNPLIYGMQYVWVFYSDRIEKVNRIVADYSFSDYRLQGLWFFDEEHCFKDACN